MLAILNGFHRRPGRGSLEEAHDLLRLLLTVAQQEGPMSPKADRLAKEIAARIPSEN
ncbi:DUF6417 family protein [Streptomyces sp. NPDC020792]|uniref:DUF6417 family protein n=1 Tax=Streptomyces sp. NPDC020792 TaxID=3365089 RepID=UPI0037A13044